MGDELIVSDKCRFMCVSAYNCVWRFKSSSGRGLEFDALLRNEVNSNGVKRRDFVSVTFYFGSRIPSDLQVFISRSDVVETETWCQSERRIGTRRDSIIEITPTLHSIKILPVGIHMSQIESIKSSNETTKKFKVFSNGAAFGGLSRLKRVSGFGTNCESGAKQWEMKVSAYNCVWRFKSSSGKGLEFDALLGNEVNSNAVKRRDFVWVTFYFDRGVDVTVVTLGISNLLRIKLKDLIKILRGLLKSIFTKEHGWLTWWNGNPEWERCGGLAVDVD
nr:hypothetical protein [Tanacetum cinerariifolium]